MDPKVQLCKLKVLVFADFVQLPPPTAAPCIMASIALEGSVIFKSGVQEKGEPQRKEENEKVLFFKLITPHGRQDPTLSGFHV